MCFPHFLWSKSWADNQIFLRGTDDSFYRLKNTSCLFIDWIISTDNMTELQLHTRSCSWTNQVAHLPLGFADSCGIYSESLKKFNKHDQLILEVKIVKKWGTHRERRQQSNGISFVDRLHSCQAICNLEVSRDPISIFSIHGLKATATFWQILYIPMLSYLPWHFYNIYFFY